MTSPKALLNKFEGFAKKRFGQHFLSSPGVIENIVRGANIQPDEQIIEIGPGLGALSQSLMGLGNPYRAFEIDRDMIRFLRHEYPQMNIKSCDAARVDWREELEPSWVCVSNLPYNVGTTIVTNMLYAEGIFSRLIVMLQQEVAQRILAPAGDRKRGSLSVFCQLYSRVSRVLHVPPGAFYPPPKVDSLVIRLEPERHPAWLNHPVSSEFLERLIKRGFTQPRKTLSNNLKRAYSVDILPQAFAASNIDPKRRPATLDVSEWVLLGCALEQFNETG